QYFSWIDSCTLFSLYSIPEPPQTIMVPYQANGSLNIRSFMPSPLARRHSLEQEAVTARLLRLSKDRTQDSKDQILSLFNDLDTLDKKVELLHKLPNEELYFVLEILFPHLSPDDFLFCLCNLELSQLKEAIYLTEHGLIGAVRQCLLSGSETAKKQFQEKAEALLFELSSYCNRHLKADLGNLADEFRSLKLHKISPSKLEEIKDLTQRIQHEQNIFIKLERLMRYFEWEPLVKSTFNDLTSSYSRSSMRLLPSGPYLPDSLFKILTEKAFGSAKDELEAADYIFEKWTFTSTEELAEIGLPPNWPKAKEALVKLGLKTILDLKMNHIYNKVLLKDFIERKKTETQTAALAAASGDIDD
ncbi:MAG: hypothetical protein KDK62_07870, partial [Chlamydiia bacterium]|nr:hypothetical protein [Chlamydiia bacterium]